MTKAVFISRPMIYLQSKRRKLENIQRDFPQAEIIDVTSKAEMPWLQFSPFYPIGDIPIPFSPGMFSKSVEGIWQGLKVFEAFDIDLASFQNDRMKGLKRTVRKYGPVSGHRKGVHGEILLSYIEARKQIYIPSYQWVLENRLQGLVEELAGKAKSHDLVLLDYDIHADIEDPAKPLSHASILKRAIEKQITLG